MSTCSSTGERRRGRPRCTTTARAGWSTATTRTPRGCAGGAGSTTAAGRAVAFAAGDIHSIEYGDDTFFVRVTGGDVETKETLRFDVEKKTVEIANRARGQR